MKPSDNLNKKFVIDSSKTPKPEPNIKLLRKIKSRSVGFMTREEYNARREYLNELPDRELYND